MPVRRVVAHEKVTDDAGRVALQRGPIVYAAEWVDNAGGKVRNLVLPDDTRLASEFRPALLNGVTVVTGRARSLAVDAGGGVCRPTASSSRSPRDVGEPWAGRDDRLAAADGGGRAPDAFATVANAATVTASAPAARRGKSPRPINDGEAPASSDGPASYFDCWPTRGSATEWVEMTFAKPATVSESSVYWFDDTGHGGVRVPASWRILDKDGTTWKPVEAVDAYGIARDAFNRVSFRPVTTGALRIEVTMQPTFSAGLQEWTAK